MRHNFPPRPCPACSGRGREVLFRQSFASIAGVSLMDGYDVVACEGCGLAFADRIPDQHIFNQYYADASKYEFSHSGGQQHDAETRRLASLASWIASHVNPSSRLLDVGCATGELLAQLARYGFTNLTGLDPSASCVRYAQTHHNLRMIQGVLTRRPQDEPRFEVVVLSAVLEHIPDLHGLLSELSDWLMADGSLILEVPDAEHFSDAFNAPYQEFSVEHVNFFSARALDNLLAYHGFRRVAVRQELIYAGPNLTGPVLTMIFSRTPIPPSPMKETASADGVKRYLDKCAAMIQEELRLIETLVTAQTPILVWGIGTLCQRLLATTDLGKANIRAFIDSNPHYQGKMFEDRPVLPPSAVAGRSEAILISSWTFQNEIACQIREELRCDNDLLVFGPH